MSCIQSAIIFALIILFQDSISAQDWFSYQSQRQINDLVEQGDELYLATDAGLVVINKNTLEKKIFNKANSNLSNNHIPTITEATNGDIWIGTYDVSFAKFTGTDFQDPITLEGQYNPNTLEMYDLKIASNGDMWVATSQAVFHRQEQTWSQYGKAELGDSFFEAWDIAINEEGEVFVASNSIFKFEDGEWTNLTEDTEILAYLGADLFLSASGDLFLAGDLDKIGRFDGQEWKTYDNGGLNGSEIIRFTEDLEGNIYFNTRRDGIFKLEGETWVAFQDINTNFFYIDQQGNNWLNNNIHLTVNENGNTRSTLISSFTIEYNSIYQITKGVNGSMYFITASDDNISVFDTNGNWSFLPLPSFAQSFESYQDVFAFSDEDIWLASDSGLFHYDGNEWTFNPLGACRSIAVDSQEKMYVRGASVIYIIEDGAVSEYNTANSPLSAEYMAGHGVDAEDNLWIAEWEINTIHKVASDGTWTTYTAAEYPEIDRPSGDFHFDVNGNVWVPHDSFGALKFDGETWSNPFEGNVDQVANYQAHAIESDVAGKVYFAHQYGVTTLLEGEWEDVLIKHIPNEFNSSNSTLKFDDEGTLWWGNNRGTGVFAYAKNNPTSISSQLKQNLDFSHYPNPSNDYILLNFTLQSKSVVKIAVFNQLGQLQSNLDLGQLPAGSFQQVVEVADLPSGFYLLRLEVNGQAFAKRMIVE